MMEGFCCIIHGQIVNVQSHRTLNLVTKLPIDDTAEREKWLSRCLQNLVKDIFILIWNSSKSETLCYTQLKT